MKALQPSAVSIHGDPPSLHSTRRRRSNNFSNAKKQALHKADKSSAGEWDAGVLEVCGLLNNAPHYYTTSSCAGRCFLYTGPGIKATDQFQRYQVSHDPIAEDSYWGALEHMDTSNTPDGCLWLRFEPFLLHTACRSLRAARKLMDAARPVFKNVGITTWNDSRYLVAVWGDEGLDMVLVVDGQFVLQGREAWLTETVNEKFRRNQAKLDSFAEAVRELVNNDSLHDDEEDRGDDGPSSYLPRHYDIIGDIALLHTVHGAPTPDQLKDLAQSILTRHPKQVNVVALRDSVLTGPERAPNLLRVLAGPDRSVTTHREYGVACVVDVAQTFFSPRMASERFRLCQQHQKHEVPQNILVLFCGVAMEAFLLAVHAPNVQSVTAVDQNPAAMACAARGWRNLQRTHPAAAAKVVLRTANVLAESADDDKNRYNRIVVPRPKLANEAEDKDLQKAIWKRVLSWVNPESSCLVHWYDFCPAHESPNVDWMQTETSGTVQVLHVATVGSVAQRQVRVCIDLLVTKTTIDGNLDTVR